MRFKSLVASALCVAAVAAVGATPLAFGAEAKASRDVVLTGQIAGGGAVVVRLSSDGRMVKRISAPIPVACDSGGGFSVNDYWTRLRVRPGLRISASYQDSSVEDNTAFEVSNSLRAQTNRRRTRVWGTWQLTIDVRDMTTGETDHCDSGALRFSARR